MKKQSGMTLLEIMLVLAIIASIIVLSFTQYQSLKIDQNAQQLLANVEYLIQGAKSYYQANCRGLFNPNNFNNQSGNYASYRNYDGGGSFGALNPAASPTSPKALNITTDLLTPGSNLNAYVVQLNLSSNASTRTVSACCTPGLTSPLTYPAQIITQDKVPVWQIQVAVKILDTSQIQMYRKLLVADCISDLAGSTVTPCSLSGGGGTGSYLVFTRLPSANSTASMSNQSPLAPSMAVLKEFNNLYTNDPMYDLSNPSNIEYYLCGG